MIVSSGPVKPPSRRAPRFDVLAWWRRGGWLERVAVVGMFAIIVGFALNLALRPETIRYTGTFVATGSMSTPRLGATATLLPNGRVLVAGGVGSDVSTMLASAELYDPGLGRFVPTGSMAEQRADSNAVLLKDGRVLIAGGHGLDGTGPWVPLATAELYDPATGAFTTTGSMRIPRVFFSMVLLADGRVLVAGGLTGTQASTTTAASAELYDPRTGAFTLTGNLSIGREDATAALLPDGRVLVAGGASSDLPDDPITATAELYDPASGMFARTGSMSSALGDRSATILLDGTVLLAGGRGAGDTTSGSTSVELYDVASGTFTSVAPMLRPRDLPNLVVLFDGTVLVAGGAGPAELFDFDHRTFSATGTTLRPMLEATATILPNGEVLFAGGSAGTNGTTEAELYR